MLSYSKSGTSAAVDFDSIFFALVYCWVHVSFYWLMFFRLFDTCSCACSLIGTCHLLYLEPT